MAMCEKCGKNGYTPYQMSVDPAEQKFVGPCCKDVVAHVHQLQPPPPVRVVVPITPTDEFEYGLELSSKVGVRAYANYHGLQVSFEKTPTEIRRWAETQGLVETRTGT